jgi:hypothetical protein
MVPFVVLLGMIATLFGVGAIAFGIPNNAFGFGNTMIMAGTTAVSAGFVVLALAAVLRAIERSGRAITAADEIEALSAERARTAPLPRAPAPVAPRAESPPGERVEAPLAARPSWSARREEGGRESLRAPAPRPAAPLRGEPGPMPAPRAPARAEPSREPIAEPPRPVAARGRAPAASEADESVAAAHAREAAAEPAAPPERRRFFAWTRRGSTREAGERPVEPKVAIAEPHAGPSFGHVDPSAEAAHWADHGEDWEERRGPPRPTSERPPTTRRPPPGREEQVEIIKSGTVDGMSYTLYSDGSIDAEFPDGKLRFASIDDLRQHLGERGS